MYVALMNNDLYRIGKFEIKNKLKKTQLNLNLDFTYNIINKNIECNYLTFKKNTKEACIEIYYKSIFIGSIKLITLASNIDITIIDTVCSNSNSMLMPLDNLLINYTEESLNEIIELLEISIK